MSPVPRKGRHGGLGQWGNYKESKKHRRELTRRREMKHKGRYVCSKVTGGKRGGTENLPTITALEVVLVNNLTNKKSYQQWFLIFVRGYPGSLAGDFLQSCRLL